MNYQDYDAMTRRQAIQSTDAGISKSINAALSGGVTQIPDASPIEQKLQTLREMLECAHDGLALLAVKLEPVRAQCPTGSGIGDKTGGEACEVEQRLQFLIDSAAALSRKLSDLRGELRI